MTSGYQRLCEGGIECVGRVVALRDDVLILRETGGCFSAAALGTSPEYPAGITKGLAAARSDSPR